MANAYEFIISRSISLPPRAGNGSMGHGSVGRMGHNFGWVTWVVGRSTLTHDPLLFALYFRSALILQTILPFLINTYVMFLITHGTEWPILC